ncbi:MAG: exodeoxyribonuclease III [Deltaproteobacteria bacterium]|nr:exodeoxyribonuclease III [Deltaproteobacteria bacterium]
MTYRIATFNANSIRARLDIILAWLSRHRPNVLCLQETKVPDEDFPIKPIIQAGYQVVFKGQKSYNGVAVLCLSQPDEVSWGLGGDDREADVRLLSVRVDGLRVVNTYIPQGREVGTPHFAYKLDFFKRLGEYFQSGFSSQEPLIWAGDLNVALTDEDVYDPKRLSGQVCFHPDEQAALKAVAQWGLVDVFRRHHPEGRAFTFWDYRLPKSVDRNLGWRIDYIWVTQPLAERSTDAFVDLEPRRMPKPSDHTFLVADFEL